MPVFEDDEAASVEARREAATETSPPQLTRILDQSEAEPVSVSVERDGSVRGIVANRAAASALVVRHRWVYSQDRLRGAADVAREWTPEQKLLRAIFGEKASTVAVKGLDDRGVPEEGATILRGDPVLCDPMSRAELRFIEEEEAVVARVEIETDGLAAALSERAVVVLEREQPLCVGDTLVRDGVELGTVTAISDDGRIEPTLYVSGDVSLSGPSASVARSRTTARQRLVARSIGAYEAATERPINADSVAFSAVAALAERGCTALFTDFAAHKFDARSTRYAVQEAMMQAKPIAHPFSSASIAAPSAAGAPMGDIFDFFSKPKSMSPSGASLERATAYARALGVDLRYEPAHALSLAPRADATFESAGEASNDLGDPRLFGPRRAYECECGALKLMKHRGRTCDKCGVAVLDASVRSKTFAHVVLREPWSHPLLGVEVTTIAVLPPTLRESADAQLEGAFQALVSERSGDAAQRVFDLLVERLCDALTVPDRVAFDYSCGAVVVLDEALDRDALVVPLDGFAIACGPLLYGKLEELGYVVTMLSARAALRNDRDLRRATVEWALRTRPLLVLSERSNTPAFVAVEVAGVTEDPVFRVGTRLAERLALRTADRLSAHLPLSEPAIREATWLSQHREGPPLREVRASQRGWIDSVIHAPASGRVDALRRAVAERSIDPCSDARAAWIVSGCVVDDDAGLDARPVAAFVAPTVEESPSESPANDWLDRNVDELEMSVRSATSLQHMGITTIRQLVQHTEVDLLKSKNFGLKSLSELKALLAELGLSFGMRLP